MKEGGMGEIVVFCVVRAQWENGRACACVCSVADMPKEVSRVWLSFVSEAMFFIRILFLDTEPRVLQPYGDRSGKRSQTLHYDHYYSSLLGIKVTSMNDSHFSEMFPSSFLRVFIMWV
jgi:hypothetical protein